MVEIRVLGALQLSASDGRDVESLVHQAKRAALLAYLAAAVPRGLHRRDKLLALFWPELDAPRARAALSQAVYVLRATLGESALTPHADGVVGLSPDVVWCDAVAFEAALDAGRPEEALALYRGDLLDGFFISGTPEFERWQEGERERLRQRAAAGAWALAEAKAAGGDVVEAERWARWGTDLIPLDEAIIRRLMTFLRGLGDRAAAIRAYDTFVSRLEEEYELEPSAETVSLATSIREEEQRAPARHVLEPPATPLPSLPTPLPGRRSLAWIVASVAVVTALAAGGWVALRSRETSRRPLARFTLEFPAQEIGAIGGSNFALSPDGTQLVYVGKGPQRTQLLLRALDLVEAVPIPHTSGASEPFFSPDGKWLAFVVRNEIRKVPLDGGPAITVCHVTSNVSGAGWGANDVMVFATAAGLWQAAASGEGEAQILATADTARGVHYLWPEVLPSGRGVVFTRSDEAGFHLAAVSLETGTVVSLGLEGTSPHFLNPGYLLFAQPGGAVLAVRFDLHTVRVIGPTFPVADGVTVGIAGAAKMGVSQEGTLAYAPQPSRDRTLAVVDRAGNASTLALPPRGFGAVRFSPDGRRIAIAVQGADGPQPDIWTLDLVGKTFRRVTFDDRSLGPVWSPDGRWIAFASKPKGRVYGWAIRWTPADGSDSAETLLSNERGGIPGDFTPDGEALLFQQRRPATGWDVWMLPIKGERMPRPYLAGPSDEHSPVVSPDGKWLAYVSDESGREEVYVRTFPHPGAPVQVSVGGGREPRWARSGRELFYRNQHGMVAAMVRTAPSFSVERRSVLFEDKAYQSFEVGPAYDVHPDGRRFLMVRRGPESPQAVVMLNWLEHLREAGVRGTRSP